jgi:hypothetical protein
MANHTTAAIDPSSVASVSSKLTLAASGGAVFFGLTANEIAALGGLLIAFLSFLVSIWFKWQHLKAVREVVLKKPEGIICEVPNDKV